jgi:signal transduction histidine kinase
MVAEVRTVDELLRDREAEALQYTIWVRVVFLFLAIVITLSNAESLLDVVFTLVFVTTHAVLLAWSLRLARRHERLLLVGGTLVTLDATAIVAFPIMWYMSVGGSEISPAYLVKNDQVLLVAVFMCVNALTLRPVFPAVIAAVGVFELVGFLLFASADPRFTFTSSNVETVLGSGVKPGFYAWRIVATLLLGALIISLAIRARRTIRQVIELEVTNLRIQAEQARRITQARLGAVGNLVAGIAHEINTPLGVIASSLGTVDKCVEHLGRAIDEAPDLEGLREDRRLQASTAALQDVRRTASSAGDRIGTLVASLEDFARLDRAETAEADLNECLESTLPLIDPSLKGEVEIVKRYTDLPPLICRVGAIHQVFLIVLTNAFEAMQGSGTLYLETYATDGVGVSIRDTGCGMEPEQVERLFEIGFTPAAGRVRLKLGLPTVRRIIEDHNGRVSVESKVGEGTTFRIELPRRPADQE